MLIEVPGYQLIEKLSENAAFRIYRGQRLQDKQAVLIKVLNYPNPAPKYLALLSQEFEILRFLDFPGVEKAYALENHQQWWMIVFEDFGGRPLDELGIAGRLKPKEFLNLALQLVDTIREIHDRQVIHKNISPSNIYFNLSTHQAKLTNFGSASLVSREKVPLQSPYKLTEILPYISPELTGRMNRTVDYRTDYYSLGATLYELLTGMPPFSGESPLEFVHAHLAIQPASPDSHIVPWKSSPIAFQIISAILLKLLAKNPEDRYQTPSSLQADLLQALSALQKPVKEGSERSVFVPGLADRPVELNIPQFVIGREQETEILLQAFQRTITGPMELVLVSGQAGVGKTTLVNQLVHLVTEQQALFLYAKYDQARRLEIYPLLVDILEEFCRLVLSEPTPSFNQWQERIKVAVAPHGQLLIDLCPQLEKIIGRQPSVETADEESVRLQIHQVVIRFLQAICRSDNHVVIFLDDLQWIGADSIQFWKKIISNTSLQNLLVVGAYRDNGGDQKHPIHALIREVEANQGKVTQLRLQNLELPLIQRLVADALASDPAEVSQLTRLVFQKTEGNPHFTIEFLKSLYRDQLLIFNQDDQKWHWDADRIDEYAIAGNVVDFFVHEIVNMDESTQKILQYAALLGRRFDAANLLAILGQEKADSLAYSLWRAMTAGFIYPLDENYRFLAGEYEDSSVVSKSELLPSLANLLEQQIFFEFQHDHVQEAAIAMLDEQQMINNSLKIGWSLLGKAERNSQQTVLENLLTIVDHLNSGSVMIKDPTEAIKAARLNLIAGNQARAAAAFKVASRYFNTGIKLLPAESWKDQYTLTLDLYISGAEVALANGDQGNAEAFALTAEENVRTLLDKVRIIKIRLDIYLIQTQLDQVIEFGIGAIKMLGFDLELKESPVLNMDIAVQLPAMIEPRALEISRLIEPLISASFANNDPRFAQLILFYIDLFTRFGNPPNASFIYISFAVTILREFEQVEQGYRVGRMALELAEKSGRSNTLYAVRFIYYGFIHHWLEPARESVRGLNENVWPAYESGDLRFSINSLDLGFQNSLFIGLPLEQLKLEQAEAMRRIEIQRQMMYTVRFRIWSQVVLNLMGEARHPQEINGQLFNEEEALKLEEGGQNAAYTFNLHAAQAFLSLFFREPQRAVKNSTLANTLKKGIGSHLIYAHHIFIYSLALLSARLDVSDLAARLDKVEGNLRLMRQWAGLVPENFLHQVELVEAEQARCLGNMEEAARKYEQAVQDARNNDHIHESALAAELAAEFYLAQRDTPVAKNYLIKAYSSYMAWGAKAKVMDLVNRYPEWLPPEKDEEKRKIISLADNPSTNEFASSIDLSTILKASMELAQETNLEVLLRKMMAILIENAGAQSGSLILLQNDRWFIKVQASTDPGQDFILRSIPLEYLSPQIGEPHLPISIIHYVINLKVDLVLDDASAYRQFSRDAYIQNRQPKSILCAPLLNQGVLSGVVYLENNLITGAFTSDRLEIVRLISSQAAVSIEKARLYENMETLVEERTRKLSEANSRLRMEINERVRVEEALRYNEAVLRKGLEILPTGVWVIDKTSRIISGNPEALRIWSGGKYVDWREFEDYKAWHADTGERVTAEEWAGWLAVTKGKITLDEELEIEAFDGTHRFILNSAMPIMIEEDGLVGAIIVNQDITKRKRDEAALQKAYDQLYALLDISQSIVSTLDLTSLLNLIIEQLAKVIPYEAAAIMIIEQDSLVFRVIRGPSAFQNLLNHQIPLRDLTIIEPLINKKEAIYLPDLQAHEDLINTIQEYIKIPSHQFAFLRSWLLLPLIAKGDLVGALILTHSEQDYYSSQSQTLSQAYANQVAIAIQNAQLYKQAHDVATLEERNRLARELHDSVAQALYSISLFIDATRLALKTNKQEAVAEYMQELVNLSREAMSDMRLMIFELRPLILEKGGLAIALQSRLESVESRSGFDANFETVGVFHLTQDQETELYRIAQEALNNIIKHAEAEKVKVRLAEQEGCIRLMIEDDGVGFDPGMIKNGGQGFRNMRERASRIGASWSFDSAPGRGTKITIELRQ